MTNKQLHISALLHDIGKISQKAENTKKGKHSEHGYKLVSKYVYDRAILDGIKHHHGEELKTNLHTNAYIVYEADNIAAGMDRRKNTDYEAYESNHKVKLSSIFDFKQDGKYKNNMVEIKRDDILLSLSENTENTRSNYKVLQNKLTVELEKVLNNEDINVSYLLSILEKYTSFVPSTTLNEDSKDISLFDHLKSTCAVASCMDIYFKEVLKKEYVSASTFKEKRDLEMYTLATIELEGYEKFIFNITNDDALKNLRGRSFYIDIFIKNLLNELLDSLELSESNILYYSGNKAQILLPNTKKAHNILNFACKNINKWLIEKFDLDLYLIVESVNCTANNLMNKSDVYFKKLREKIAINKKQKYKNSNLQQHIFSDKLFENYDNTRECKKCKNSNVLLNDDTCELCDGFIYTGKNVLDNKKYFIVQNNSTHEVIFPNIKGETVSGYFDNKPDIEKVNKIYCINDYARFQTSTISIATFSSEKELKDFSKNSVGIKKIGALKIDVDNLENEFLHSFDGVKDKDKGGVERNYKTIARYATYERTVDLFFKNYIKAIAENGNFKVNNEHYKNDFSFLSSNKERNLQVIYSAGDETFIIGEWNEVLLVAYTINQIFKKYTNGKLTLSAGFSMFNHSYPIYNISNEIKELENYAKLNGKDSITLFNNKTTYKWGELEEVFNIINELNTICFYKEVDKSKNVNRNKIFVGKTALHNLYELLTLNKEIMIAKVAYMLGTIKANNRDIDKKEKYEQFTNSIYKKSISKKDRKYLCTALVIILYLNREQ